MLDTRLHALRLPTALLSWAEREQVITVGELLRFSPATLERSFSPRTLEQLRALLESYLGLSWEEATGGRAEPPLGPQRRPVA